MLEAGWVKVFHPGAAVRHAHDYGPLEFMQRYFDEYRGLRETSGHVEPLRLRARASARSRARRALDERAGHVRRRAGALAGSRGRQCTRAGGGWPPRSGRAPSACPARVQRALSLERRGGARRRRVDGLPRGTACAERRSPTGRAAREPRGSRSARRARARNGRARPIHIAVVIPPFAAAAAATARSSRCSTGSSAWATPAPSGCTTRTSGTARGRRRAAPAASSRSSCRCAAPVHKGFDDWHGADVVLATGWDTVYPMMLLPQLPGARLPDPGPRAGVLPDLGGGAVGGATRTSWVSTASAAGRWLRDLLARPLRPARRLVPARAWTTTSTGPGPVERRRDTVIFYAREGTPRRAVPLGAARAARSCSAAGPTLRFVLFGQDAAAPLPFEHEHLGVVPPEMLAPRYSAATVGLCLSLTNYSLIPQEMLACGLPCVDLAGGSTEAELGATGGIELAEPDPVALADAIEALLDDEELAPTLAGGDRDAESLVGRAAPQVEQRPARGAPRARADRAEPCRGHRARTGPPPTQPDWPHSSASRAPPCAAWRARTRDAARRDRAKRGPSPLPGSRSSAGAHERDAVRSPGARSVEPSCEPARGPRELVLGRPGAPAVDADADRAAERAGEPHLVVARRGPEALAADRARPDRLHERRIVRPHRPSGRQGARRRGEAGDRGRRRADEHSVRRPPEGEPVNAGAGGCGRSR